MKQRAEPPVRPPPDRWDFYKDRFGQWQWRKYEEWKVVAVSGDGYVTREECVTNARTRGFAGT